MEYKTPDKYYGHVTPEQKQQVQAAQQQNTYEQQLYDKWYNIFYNGSDSTFAAKIGGTGNPGQIDSQTGKPKLGVAASNDISIPQDDKEREIACKAAQDVMNKIHSLPMNEKNPQLIINYNIAKSFLRRCASYIKSREKSLKKQTNAAYKSGAATFNQSDIQPKSTNMKDVVTAAQNAASQTAAAFNRGDQTGYDSCFALVQPNLSNKAYNVTYYYNFFKNILDNVTDTTKRQDYTNRMNSLKLQAEQYEMQANNNEFKSGAYDRIKENNQNTTQRVYNK